MKSFRLQATELSLGLLIFAGAFAGFAGVADAATCTTQCVGGYETQSYSCVTGSGTVDFGGGYVSGAGSCGFPDGYYPAGSYSYTCYGTCTQEVWNSCLSTTRVCGPPDPCYASGTLSWGAGCSATGSFSAPDGGSVTVGNTAPGYTGSETYSCSDGVWGGPTSSSCSCGTTSDSFTCADFAGQYGIPTGATGTGSYTYNACTGAITYNGGCTCVTKTDAFDCAPVAGTYGVPAGATGTGTYSYNSCTGAVKYTGGCTVKAPTSASISASPNPAYLTGPVGVSWSANNMPKSYRVTFGNTTYPLTELTSWSGLVSDLVSAIGTYPMSVEACNEKGCATGSGSLVVGSAVIKSFTASSMNLPKGGGAVTLTWGSAGAKTCTASNALNSGDWSGPVPTSGSVTVSTTNTNTYYLSCQ